MPSRSGSVEYVKRSPFVVRSDGRSAAAAMESTPAVVVFLTMPVPSAPRNCAAERPASVIHCTMNLFAQVAFAAPSTEFPAMSLAVVHFAAEPVVFAALLGMSPETSAHQPGAAEIVPFPTWHLNLFVVVMFPASRCNVVAFNA